MHQTQPNAQVGDHLGRYRVLKIIVEVCEKVVGTKVTGFFTSLNKLLLFFGRREQSMANVHHSARGEIFGFNAKVVQGIAEIGACQKTGAKIKMIRTYRPDPGITLFDRVWHFGAIAESELVQPLIAVRRNAGVRTGGLEISR